MSAYVYLVVLIVLVFVPYFELANFGKRLLRVATFIWLHLAPTLWIALDLNIILLTFNAFKNKSQDTSLSEVLCKFILIIFMIFLFLPCASTVILVYIMISPLNSYLFMHWILDFK